MSPIRSHLLSALFLSPALASPAYQGLFLGPRASSAIAIGGGQVGGDIAGIPTLWTSLSPDSATPLTTDGSHGEVQAVDGTHQAGYVLTSAGRPQATLWSGSAASALNLNPPGYSQSSIGALLGDEQAGYATTPDGHHHAVLWHGSPDSAIDLNPPGYVSSSFSGITPDYLVGSGTPDTPGAVSHALLWNRSTSQVTDLGTGYRNAGATAIAGTQIVGITSDLSSDSRALFWENLGQTVINPTYWPAAIFDTNGTNEVGYIQPLYSTHAVVWTGNMAGAVDLAPLLPGYDPRVAASDSIDTVAAAIDAQGRIAGWYNDHYGGDYAVVWIPSALLPDPALATPALLLILLHRRRPNTCRNDSR